MIFNFYIPEGDRRLLEELKVISDQKRRSLSFVVREALELYLLGFSARKSTKKQPSQRRRARA